jgi:aldose 1-epimerase
MDRFGSFEGEDVVRLKIGASSGVEAQVMTWGAALCDLLVPLPSGEKQRVVLGFHEFEQYRLHSRHFGAIAGRFANRIKGGDLTIDGQTHKLSLNQGNPRTGAPEHHRHGGFKGFGKRNWRVMTYGGDFVVLGLVSLDGDEGYPGTLAVTCTYRLLESPGLRVELSAVTDKPTVVNLLHHAYFNLDLAAVIDEHTLEIDADFYTPIDEAVIPTGEILRVAGTPYDFTKPRAIHPTEPLTRTTGRIVYDHNFVLRKGRAFGRAASLNSQKSALTMEVWTSEPALQFNDGAMLDVPVPGYAGTTYGPRSGLCLEPQRYPDSPSHPHFTDVTLRPEQVYRQVTEYRFLQLSSGRQSCTTTTNPSGQSSTR